MGYVYQGSWKKPTKRHVNSRTGDIIERPPPSMAQLITSSPSIPQRMINQAYEEKMKRGNYLMHDQGFDSALGHLRLVSQSSDHKGSIGREHSQAGSGTKSPTRGPKTKSSAQLDSYIEEQR